MEMKMNVSYDSKVNIFKKKKSLQMYKQITELQNTWNKDCQK